MKIFAHRGYTGDGKGENTLEAFERAIERRMFIEFDVHLTKDGIPIVFHDDDLVRLANRKEKVSQLELSKLRQIPLLNDERIPTLKEALDLVNGRTLLLIELKTPKTGMFIGHKLEDKVIELLKGYKGEYMIQAFNKSTVKYCKKNLQGIKVGRLSSRCYSSRWCGDFVNYKLKHLDKETVEQFRSRKLEVFGWSVLGDSTKEAMERAELLGLDGIIL